MNLTNQMIEQLDGIKSYESEGNLQLLEAPEDQLGTQLIELYYRTDSLMTREIIRDLFEDLGMEWLRKLITRDTSTDDLLFKEFASTNDYLSMLGSNDDLAVFES